MLALLVDDDPQVAAPMRRLMEHFGYEVLLASCGAEALEVSDETLARLDLVMTDYSMPGMNGLELTEALIARRADLPVLMVTAWGNLIDAEEAKTSGVRILLPKPFGLDELRNAVSATLEDASDAPSS